LKEGLRNLSEEINEKMNNGNENILQNDDEDHKKKEEEEDEDDKLLEVPLFTKSFNFLLLLSSLSTIHIFIKTISFSHQSQNDQMMIGERVRELEEDLVDDSCLLDSIVLLSNIGPISHLSTLYPLPSLVSLPLQHILLPSKLSNLLIHHFIPIDIWRRFLLKFGDDIGFTFF